ncbi:MAG TPA: hypothetical protein VLA36_02040 [Longimicrobiales bacterium]|nr:hypothetical protein [Longimicrobiales bacterium]
MNVSARRSGARRALLPLLWLFVGSPGLGAQERPTSAQDSLRVEMQRLAVLVDSLRAEVNRLQGEGKTEEAQDPLAALRAAAAAAAAAASGGAPPPAEAPSTQEFVGRGRSLQAMNPEISLTGDVFAQVMKDQTNRDNFFAREFEMSIISNLDPFSRAKIFISRHDHGGEITPFGDPEEEPEEGFAVEEGYVEWVSLPGGVGLKVGRFYQQLGQLNRWHSHAFPFQSRSLPSMTFVGEEPLAQTGASLRWLLPVGGKAGTYTATLETTRSSNEALYGTSARPSVLANLNAFWQISDATDLDLSTTWAGGRYEDDDILLSRNLYAAEISFTWIPPASAKYRGLNVRAGVMVLDGLLDPDGAPMDGTAKGVWTMAETKLNQSWLLGGRFDWTQNPHDVNETAWLVSPTLTWWQSEYVRIRGEYDLLGRSDFRDGRFLLQATFSMGPHKHETY